jgi:hypothetical protein
MAIRVISDLWAVLSAGVFPAPVHATCGCKLQILALGSRKFQRIYANHFVRSACARPVTNSSRLTGEAMRNSLTALLTIDRYERGATAGRDRAVFQIIARTVFGLQSWDVFGKMNPIGR